MTSINTNLPIFNDNELNKLLNELKIDIKAAKKAPSGNTPAEKPQEESAPPVTPQTDQADSRSVEEILREGFKLD